MRIRFEHGPRDHLKTMHPAYFAMVMATGIVSISLFVHHVPVLPIALFGFNCVFFVGILGATIFRFLRYRSDFISDIQSHGRSMGFFTTVAGTAVLGTQIIVLFGAVRPAMLLWFLAAILWTLITYGILTVLTAKAEKPSLREGLNGAWLLIVVATQSIAVLTVLLLEGGAFASFRHEMIFLALVLWLGGGGLYLCLMTLIFFRYTFIHMGPEDLTPPYWLSMGAVAISTLAGALIIEHGSFSPVIAEILPFMKGFVLFFWAIATWWIPMLIALGIWRYLICETPFIYDPLYWGGVFPLGMYSVCTFHLGLAIDIAFLAPLSMLFMLLAAAAWITTFIGFLDSRRISKAPDGPVQTFHGGRGHSK